MATRLERLRAKLDDTRVDALFVTQEHNRRYLSGFTGSNGALLVSRDEARISTDFRYWEQAETQAQGFTLQRAARNFSEWFGEFVAPFGGKKLGFEAAHVTVDLHRQMRELIGELPAGQRPELVPTTGIVEELRAIKEPEEVAALERVVALGDAAFASVADRVEPGWTERQVAWEIERYIREHGGDGLSFSTIVAGGPWGAMPHARARDAVLKAGEGVVIDMGALLGGYCSDMTRTIFLGEPDDRFKRIYDIVLTAQLAAEEMIEADMTGDTAHNLAHQVIREAGHGEEFGHGLGHGIGLQVHEAPWLRPESTSVLQDGIVFSVEPGIYITGWGGVRIEDLVVLENGRCRVLTTSPKVRLAAM
jgi:Xaa-Pro aminopeptidase